MVTRRTVTLDDAVLDEARWLLGTRSIRATIEAALREAIRRRQLEELRRALGTVELALVPAALEKLRDDA